MLYDLLVPLAKDSIVFNVFRYITFRTAMATVTALVISFVLGPWLIGRLRELQDGGETIREDTPERHRDEGGHAHHGRAHHPGGDPGLDAAVGQPPQPLRLGADPGHRRAWA